MNKPTSLRSEPNGPLKKSIGQQIKARRKMLQLNQLSFAERIGCKHTTLSQWECGNVFPPIPLLIKICSVFDCSLDEIILHKQEADSSTSLREQNILGLWRALPETSKVEIYDRMVSEALNKTPQD